MPFLALYPAHILGEVGELVSRSGLFAKFIILLLFILSIISWAVMVERARRVKRAESASRAFWQRFEAAREGGASMDELSEWCDSDTHSALSKVFLWFSREYWPLHRQRAGDPKSERLLLGLLQRGADRVKEHSLDRLEHGVTWLATLASIAPFLGLLGTVWGIMGSFIELGRQGSATLDVVGPGIAEALITTVCGLAVAIPAVVGYNYFMRKLQQQESELQRLSSLLADVVAERELEGLSSTVLQEG